MADDFASSSRRRGTPYDRAAAVTPNDGVDLPSIASALFIGGAGNVVLITAGGDTVTLTGCLVGTIYPIRTARVKATSTTATLIVALW